MTYFSDRELGERPRDEEEIGERPWGGLRVLMEGKVNDGSFGIDYPENCPDGRGPTGTNRSDFGVAMCAEIPNLPEENPWRSSRYGWYEVPKTIDVLDMIEFCWHHVGEPSKGAYHEFFKHHELTFNREIGQQKFSEEVNRIFSRNSLAYTLTNDGRIERLGPPVLREELISAHFQSGDDDLNGLLENARRKFFSPREEIRAEALQELWDAWERLKTTGQGAQKRSRLPHSLTQRRDNLLPSFVTTWKWTQKS